MLSSIRSQPIKLVPASPHYPSKPRPWFNRGFRGISTVLPARSFRTLVASFSTPTARRLLASAWYHTLASRSASRSILHFANPCRKWCSFGRAVNAGGNRLLQAKWSVRASGDTHGGTEPTSESSLGAPAILFSPDSIGLSLATVGPSSNSPPRGMASRTLDSEDCGTKEGLDW